MAFFIGTIPKLFGLSNESLSVECRVGVLFISLLYIFISIFTSKKTFIKTQSFRFFLLFWFIYGSKKFVYSNITDIEEAMSIIKKYEPTIREKMTGK